MAVSFTECVDFLKNHDNFVIFTHAAADGDTIGSGCALCSALKRYGKHAVVFNPDHIPNRLMFLADEFYPEGEKIVNTLPSGTYTYISVDIASPAMLKCMGEDAVSKLNFELSIDHHDLNSIKTDRLYCVPSAPACGEIIAEIITALSEFYNTERFSRYEILCLYAAISSDSGCFRFSSTSPKTHYIAGDLMQNGQKYNIDFSKINRNIFESKTKGQLALERDAYDHLEFFYGGKVAVITLSDSVLALDYVDSGDVEQINNIPRQIAGVEVSVMIRKSGDEIKCSFRSNDYYDVASLAKFFGGGGHIHAAGCRFRTDVNDAKNQIIEKLKSEFYAG